MEGEGKEGPFIQIRAKLAYLQVHAHYVPIYEGPSPHGFLKLDADRLYSITAFLVYKKK